MVVEVGRVGMLHHFGDETGICSSPKAIAADKKAFLFIAPDRLLLEVVN